MKNATVKSFIWFVLVCCAIGTAGYASGPVANLTERWTLSANGWTFVHPQSGLAARTNESLLVKFASRSPENPFSQSADNAAIIGGSMASSGQFAGDYTSMESIAFDVLASNVTDAVFLMYCGSSLWGCQFVVPSSTSPWATISLPLCADRWFRIAGNGVLDFPADIKTVTEMHIEVSRNSDIFAIQSLAVDNLKVIGPWCGPFENGVSTYWYQEYGLVGNDANAFADTDGDGLNNLGEFLAGTIPTDDASTFKVSIEIDQAGNPVLRWPHVKGRTFGVWRSGDLAPAGSFEKVAQGLSDQGTADNSLPIDNGASGSAFYRVEIEQ